MHQIVRRQYPALLVGIFVATTAAAQGPRDDTLEEILVTADKLNARSVQDTPFAISVIGGDQIEREGFTQVTELLRQMPGVVAQQVGGGSANINIRGVATSLAGDPTVGFYLDDVPFVIPQFNILPDLNPYDLSHIEVLRGPQGTLYGASSLGGTVRVLTQDPVIDEFSGKVTGGYSSTDGGGDNYKMQGVVNIPIVDEKLALRLVASEIDRDGYIDLPLTGQDDFNELKETTYRAKVLFTPTDQLEINASYWTFDQKNHTSYSDEDFDFYAVNALVGPDFLPTGNVTPVAAKNLEAPMKYDLSNLNFAVDFDNISWYTSASYLEIDQKTNFRFYVETPAMVENKFDVTSFETRISSIGEGALSWTLGGFYQENDGTAPYYGYFALDTDPVTEVEVLLSDQRRTSEQQAVFGEVHYALLPDRLELTLGARYFEDERTEEEKSLTTPTAQALIAEGYDLKRSDKFDKTTGRINLAYTPDEYSMYYVNVAEGFRSGNIQCGACLLGGFAPPVTDPEDLISYEIGTKLELAGSSLTLDLAAYYWEWDKIQVLLIDFAPTGVLALYYKNAGKATGEGVDVALSYRGIEGLVLSLAGNINQTQYEDSLPSAGIEKGDTVEMTPEYNVTASASYQWQLTSGLTGTAYAAYTVIDGSPTYSTFSAPLQSDEIKSLSARLGISSDRWSAVLTAENLLNDSGIQNELPLYSASGGAPVYQPPRTLGVEVSYNF